MDKLPTDRPSSWAVGGGNITAVCATYICVSASVFADLCGQPCEYVHMCCGRVPMWVYAYQGHMLGSVWLPAAPRRDQGPLAASSLTNNGIQQLAVNFICILLYVLLKWNVINSYNLTEKWFQSFGSDENFSYMRDNFLKYQNSRGSFCVL